MSRTKKKVSRSKRGKRAVGQRAQSRRKVARPSPGKKRSIVSKHQKSTLIGGLRKSRTSGASPRKRSVTPPTRDKPQRIRKAPVNHPGSSLTVRGRRVDSDIPPKRYKLSLQLRARLREAIELLRKHLHGYTAAESYSLSQMDQWDATKRRRILRRAAKLRELLATPHDIIKVRTKKERKNLYQFTGQKLRRAKHYIVHKPGDAFKVQLDQGRIEITGRFPGGTVSRSKFFLFPHRPRTPKELVSMARRLQREMPEGFYTVLTAAHGDTGEPFQRDQLINRLNEYLAAYEVDSEGKPTGFSEALIGFRFMSTTLRGAVIQRRHVDARRQRQKAFNEKKRKEALRKETRLCRAKTLKGKHCKNRAVGKFKGVYLCARHKPK